jgi:hypothetical protein
MSQSRTDKQQTIKGQEAVQQKPIISRAEKTTLLGKACTVTDLAHGQAPRRKLLAASLSTMDLPTHLSFPLCFLMDRSSRTAIFFLASVFRKNFSVIHFLLVLLVSVSTVFSLFQPSMVCKQRNHSSCFYVSMCTPIIATESRLAGSSGCLIARSVIIQV